MKFNREEILKKLTTVMPGVDKRQIVDQMARFIFTGEDIITYNDHISVATPLKTDFKCSVHATQLHKLLSKVKTEFVKIENTKTELRIITKSTKAGLSTLVEDELADILRKLHKDIAKAKWKPLPKNFVEGVTMCAFSASTDESKGTMVCLKVSKNQITCGDKVRVSRYILDKPMDTFLMKASAVDDLKKFEPVKYYRSQSWIHFKTKDGTVFSCRRIEGDFADYTEAFEGFKGIKFTLPKQLKEIVETVGVITEDNEMVEKKINIMLTKNKLICKAISDSGWIEKKLSKIGYNKRDISFGINPILFSQVLDRVTTLFVSKRLALLKSGPFKHIIALFEGD